jgi:hypothetical protein
MTSTSAELLVAVDRSPELAAAHDRAGWVGLFTADGSVEDPVGSTPHIGHQEIGRFYDTFIAPRQITFHRHLDIVDHQTVVRDVTLEVEMSSGLTMNIPAFLRYDFRSADGQWKIAALRAYWELPAMVALMLRQGVKAVPTSLRLSATLVRNQGLRGAAGFLAGFRGAGKREKRLVQRYVATQGGGKRVSKLIAAGNTVAAAVTTPTSRGVLFCEISSATKEIDNTRYYAER